MKASKPFYIENDFLNLFYNNSFKTISHRKLLFIYFIMKSHNQFHIEK